MRYCNYCWIGIGLLFLLGCKEKISKPESMDFVSFTAKTTFKVSQNQEDTIQLEFRIREGFHIMSNQKSNQNIATCITFKPSENILLGEPIFPIPDPYQIGGIKEFFDSFQGNLSILLPLKIEGGTPDKEYLLNGTLKYQACDDRKCFFPRELGFTVRLKLFS